MRPLLLLAVALLLGEETNPKGFPTPSVGRAKLVGLKKTSQSKEVPGDETTVRTYLDGKSKKWFRTFEIQNNVFRYDLEVKEESAKTSLLDRDGDGKFEIRLPFEEVDGHPPEWVVKLTRTPSKLLMQSRLPVLRDTRLLQKTAFQRGNVGAALPVLALFFVDEPKPPTQEAQLNPSVAMALVMDKMAKQYKGKVFCVSYRFDSLPKKELAAAVNGMDKSMGWKVKKVPAFAFFTVQRVVDKKTKKTFLRLKFNQRVWETIQTVEEMHGFEERLSKAVTDFVKE